MTTLSSSIKIGNNPSEYDVNAIMSAPDLLFIYDDAKNKKEIQQETTEPSNEPQDAWILLICAFFYYVLIGYHMSCFSMYYVTFTEVFETSKAAAGLINSIHYCVMALSGLLATVVVEKYGCRMASLLGSCMFASGILLSSFATNIYYLYVLFGVVSGAGFGFNMLIGSVIIQYRFHKHRNFANSFVFAGVPLGQVFSPFISRYFLEHYAWRGTLLLHGGILLNTFALSLTFWPARQTKNTIAETKIKPKPSLSQMICDFSLFKNKLFLGFIAAETFNRFCFLAYIDHTVSRVVFLGNDLHFASFVLTVLCLACFLARITCTVFSTWIKHINPLFLYASCLLMMGAVEILTALANNSGTLFTCASLFGAAIGCMIPMLMLSTVLLAGVKKFARARAITNLTVAVTSLSATPLTGMVFDKTQDYNLPFYFAGTVGVMGALFAYLTFIGYSLKTRKKRAGEQTCQYKNAMNTADKRHLQVENRSRTITL